MFAMAHRPADGCRDRSALEGRFEPYLPSRCHDTLAEPVDRLGLTLFSCSVRLGLNQTAKPLYYILECSFCCVKLLTPGEFRRVVRCGEWVAGDDATTAIERGKVPDYLYFLISGGALS